MAGRMNLATMLMLRSGNNRGEGGGGNQQRNEYGNQGAQNGMWPYMPPYAEPGMRRRAEYDGGMEDRRRAYTRNEYDGEGEMRRRYQTRSEYDGEGVNDRRMGFGEQPMDNYDTEMRRRRRADGTFMHYGGGEEGGREPIRFGGMVSMEGGKRGGHHKLTREMAEEWVEGMESADPQKPRGGKWTMDQVKPLAQKYGVPTEGDRFVEFWAVMNALYSDYYSVAKKYNMLNPDFFADMAMAFINDKDAVNNKAAVYYECIVER